MLEFCDPISDKLRVNGGYIKHGKENIDDGDLAIADLTRAVSELNKWKRERKLEHAKQMKYAAFLIEIAREVLLCSAEVGYIYVKSKTAALKAKPILSELPYEISIGEAGGIAGIAASEKRAVIANASHGFISPEESHITHVHFSRSI